MPPHLKKLMNQANLENGTYEQIVTNCEEEVLEQNSFESPDELKMNTMSQHATTTNADRLRPKSHHCKKTWTLQKPMSPAKKKKKLKALKLVA